MVCVYPVAISSVNVNFAALPFDSASELEEFVDAFNSGHGAEAAILVNEKFGKCADAKTYATLMFEKESSCEKFAALVKARGWPVETLNIFSEGTAAALEALACRAEREILGQKAKPGQAAAKAGKKPL